MSLEMTRCLEDTWGSHKKLHETVVMQDVQTWIARLSTVVFLGEEMARNKEWVRIVTSFTLNLFTAIRALKYWHPVLRPIMDKISPLNRQVRRDQVLAARILEPILKARHEEIRNADERIENRISPMTQLNGSAILPMVANIRRFPFNSV